MTMVSSDGLRDPRSRCAMKFALSPSRSASSACMNPWRCRSARTRSPSRRVTCSTVKTLEDLTRRAITEMLAQRQTWTMLDSDPHSPPQAPEGASWSATTKIDGASRAIS